MLAKPLDLVGSLELDNGSYAGMTVVNNFAYVVGVSFIMLCSDPSASGFCLIGKMLPVERLRIIDVTNLKAPVLIGNLELDSKTCSEATVAGDYAYVMCDGSLKVIDISKPEAPSLVGISGECDLYIMSELDKKSFNDLLKSSPNASYVVVDDEIYAIENETLKRIGSGDWLKDI